MGRVIRFARSAAGAAAIWISLPQPPRHASIVMTAKLRLESLAALRKQQPPPVGCQRVWRQSPRQRQQGGRESERW